MNQPKSLKYKNELISETELTPELKELLPKIENLQSIYNKLLETEKQTHEMLLKTQGKIEYLSEPVNPLLDKILDDRKAKNVIQANQKFKNNQRSLYDRHNNATI